MSMICIAFFSLLFIITSFLTIMNSKIVKNVYGNIDFETMIFDCNSNDIRNFSEYYIRGTIEDKVFIDDVAINNYSFTYYNENFLTRKGINVVDGVIISKKISETYSLMKNDKINVAYGNNEKELLITEIIENDNDEMSFYLPAEELNEYNGNVSFIVSFTYEDLNDVAMKIKKYDSSNIKDYDYVFSFLETIRSIRIVFIFILLLIDIIICYSLYKIVSVLILKRENEIGIRISMGYKRGDIITIYSFSTLFIVIVSAIISCFLAVPTYNVLLRRINEMMKIKIMINFNFLFAFLNIIFISIICFMLIFVAFKRTFNKRIINMIRGYKNV